MRVRRGSNGRVECARWRGVVFRMSNMQPGARLAALPGFGRAWEAVAGCVGLSCLLPSEGCGSPYLLCAAEGALLLHRMHLPRRFASSRRSAIRSGITCIQGRARQNLGLPGAVAVSENALAAASRKRAGPRAWGRGGLARAARVFTLQFRRRAAHTSAPPGEEGRLPRHGRSNTGGLLNLTGRLVHAQMWLGRGVRPHYHLRDARVHALVLIAEITKIINDQ